MRSAWQFLTGYVWNRSMRVFISQKLPEDYEYSDSFKGPCLLRYHFYLLSSPASVAAANIWTEKKCKPMNRLTEAWTSQLPLSLSNHVILTNSLSLTFNFSTSKRRKIALSTHKVAAMPNIKSLSATNVLYIWHQFNPESLLWRISSPGYRWGSWGSETWLTSNRNSLGWA